MSPSSTKPPSSMHLNRPHAAHSTERQFTGLVLVVEDNEVSALIAKAELRRLGIRVDHAQNGIDALRLCEARRFDLILMDCEMPLMNGYETTSRIRQIERAEGRGRTPVVAFTAHPLIGGCDSFLAIGMDGYLSKPLGPDALAQMLQRFLPLST